MKWWVGGSILALGCVTGVHGEDRPQTGPLPVRDPKVLNLSLRDAVVLGVQNHPDIEIERFNVRIRDEERTEAGGDFDIVTFVNTAYQDTKSEIQNVPNATGTAATTELQNEGRFSFQGGLRKKFDSGTLAEFTYNTDRSKMTPTLTPPGAFKTLNPSISERVKLEVTQPLLKGGWWEVNTAKIRIAENRQVSARYGVLEKVRTTVQQIEEAYWNLVFAREEVEIQHAGVGIARGRLSVVREGARLGRLDEGSIVETRLSVAQALEAETLAQTASLDAEERLRVLIQPVDAPVAGGITLRPLSDLPDPSDAPIGAHQVEDVYRRRPDYLQAELEVGAARIGVEEAWNQMLPQLDLKGSVGLSGVDGDYGASTRDLFSGDTYEWRLAMILEYPFGNHAAKGRYRKAHWQFLQARMKLTALGRQIAVEISESTRGLAGALDRYVAARRTLKLSEERLRVESDRLDAGKTALEFVLQAQGELSRARVERLRQGRDYQKAYVRLRAALGLTLQGYPIEAP